MEGLVVNSQAWRGRRVLVTGHTGFKGSWLCLWLQALGADVSGYALAPAGEQNLFTLARVADGMHSVIGDIRDERAVARAVQQARPEVVIHMAAQALVRDSYQRPVETYAVNVMGTVNLLEAVRQTAGVKAVVNVTTDKCYDNREWLWPYREGDALGGHDPYSSSKACSEIVSAAWRSSFFGSGAPLLATARAGNVIGGGDWAADRLVPDLLAAFTRCQPALLRRPQAVRPWQHVLEPLRGYLTLAQKLLEGDASFAQAWNFGPMQGDARSVDWVASELARCWGDGARVEHGPADGPHEATFLRLDTSRAAALLDWHPRLRLPDALRLTAAWEQRRLQGADARAITLEQIRDYEALDVAP